jgi:hypothetical protein
MWIELSKCSYISEASSYAFEVRLGAWIKRTFSLKPALNRIRESRKDFRGNPDDPDSFTKQVDAMR